MSLTSHNEGSTWTKQQTTTLMVVVAMHIWLFWVPWTNHTSQLATPIESILLLLPIESKATTSERKLKHIRVPVPQHISSTDEQPASDDRAPHLPAAEVPHTEVANQVDWYAAAVAAARQAAKTTATLSTVREFDHSIRQQAPIAIEPPSAFTQPAHRFGDITKTPDGDDVVWLSSNCYQVAKSYADHFKSIATGMPDTGKNTVICKKSIGQSQGNAHMFDSLKHPSASDHTEQLGP